MFIHRISGAVVGTLFVLHLGAASSDAADPNRSVDTGQPRELINDPVCWSAEQPYDSRYCDFALRIKLGECRRLRAASSLFTACRAVEP